MDSSVSSIITKVVVQPANLNSEIYNFLHKKLERFYGNKCSEEHGYITEIKKIIKILGTKISPTTSDIIFEVEVDILALKPKVDKIYNSLVCMVFSRGIFAEIKNKLKVLIPIDKIKNYSLNSDENKFSHKNDKTNNIEKGSYIKVEIYNFKYSDGNFNCLGVLV